MPAKQVSGRSSSIANQTTCFVLVSAFGECYPCPTRSAEHRNDRYRKSCWHRDHGGWRARKGIPPAGEVSRLALAGAGGRRKAERRPSPEIVGGCADRCGEPVASRNARLRRDEDEIRCGGVGNLSWNLLLYPCANFRGERFSRIVRSGIDALERQHHKRHRRISGAHTANTLNKGTTGANLGAPRTDNPSSAATHGNAVNTPAANSAIQALGNTETGIVKK